MADVDRRLAGIVAADVVGYSAQVGADEPGTLARNTITTAISPLCPLTVLTRPTAVQRKALGLLGLECSQ